VKKPPEQVNNLVHYPRKNIKKEKMEGRNK
jgi:hypothetical protein